MESDTNTVVVTVVVIRRLKENIHKIAKRLQYKHGFNCDMCQNYKISYDGVAIENVFFILGRLNGSNLAKAGLIQAKLH